MAELVYPPVIAAARTMFRVLDWKIDLAGAEWVPRSGGALLVSNHISYLDFVFCGQAAQPSRRLVRFMAKQSVFDHRISGPLMRGMRHIPVDRADGVQAFQHALRALQDGEVVGVFPEATISRSFTLKRFKSGAARLATEAGVPMVPMALWGTQRLWTKGRPRNFSRSHIPVRIRVGEPLRPEPDEKPDALTDRLRDRVETLLVQAQQDYPDRPKGPDDGWWLPAHLGGTAPTPEQARQ
ncbi:glycerol acyltransferase [Wenjunlia vitaminophila]|uniref:Glycerol acyltransferase n=1 Tax=Wenjunlia vitaminophila TaxID=76728 RepID=A0A0T6LQ61_WENVI|nr:lysophospholipid acyltransferase family protein [Wenjunlia vitaminophila]KRV48247.1 glycerol acyltransferase [Wenjunlia vitaminophila]